MFLCPHSSQSAPVQCHAAAWPGSSAAFFTSPCSQGSSAMPDTWWVLSVSRRKEWCYYVVSVTAGAPWPSFLINCKFLSLLKRELIDGGGKEIAFKRKGARTAYWLLLACELLTYGEREEVLGSAPLLCLHSSFPPCPAFLLWIPGLLHSEGKWVPVPEKACLFGRGLCAGVALVCSPSRAHPAPGSQPSAAPVPLSASHIFLVLVPRQPVRPSLPHLLSLPGVNWWLSVVYFSSRKSS